ncbi:hypothetical protein KSB_48150 [Ktedonobacter robiniae]|uniref:HTH lysR-type domain-containing protein n=1 Tax=Ktedonobacter robiniae TaxID=2778365 RepID=A0ABQ3UUJ6_9CHLR|nr:hypothetical protein KSB_48150 [Ktedonobacter robiniae]
MELLQLKYFLTVARLEHMTRAAEELGIAQPPLSQTIARLEEELGVPLFDRLGRNIQRLEQSGRKFAPTHTVAREENAAFHISKTGTTLSFRLRPNLGTFSTAKTPSECWGIPCHVTDPIPDLE